MPSATNREILRLALPAIVSNITTPLLGLADTAITGHMGSTAPLAAVAVGGSMFSLTYWVMNFLRMGTSGLTSQSYGASVAGKASGPTPRDILRFSMAAAMVLAVALVALSAPLCSALLAFMDADGPTTAQAAVYFRILIFGAPAVLGSYTLTGWFLGMQDSRSPMWMALVTNVVNIAASLVLVYGFGLGIEGVALGTLTAQYAGFGLGLLMLRRYGTAAAPGARGLRGLLRAIPLRRFFSTNTDIFLRTLCLAAVTLWFTRTGARQGTDVVAANALLMQLFILFSYFMDGFAFAGEAMSGKYYGMAERRMLLATVRGVFMWGLAVVALFTAVYGLCGGWILGCLSDRPEVVAMATRYLPWAVAVPAAGVTAFVWDGVFIGMTLTRRMLVSMAVATGAFFLLCFLAFPVMGNHGLWLAFIAYLVLRGLVQTLLFVIPARGGR